MIGDPRLPERFWAKVVSAPSTGCWVWVGAHGLEGHGRVRGADGRVIQAHRWSYEALAGPIPDGLELDHLCRNPPCVNPAHLEPATRRINQLRGEGVAGRNARRTHCSKGHEYDTRRADDSRRCKTCHREQERDRRRRRHPEASP